MDTSPDTIMWEARARPGQQAALLEWADRHAVPALLADPGCAGITTYLGGQDRVVMIAHTTGAGPAIPEPPAGLIERPVHQWPFRCQRTYQRPGG
jgi:hypothetical protein